MGHKHSLKLATRITPHLLICTGGLLAFVLLALYPSQRSLADLDREIYALKDQIEAQEILIPSYKALLKKVSMKEHGVLPFPQKQRLEAHKVAEISSVFGEKARESDLELLSVSPSVDSLVGEANVLSAGVILKGGFFHFREFLIHIGEIPYLEHIEEIQIQPGDGAKEFRVQVLLALDR